ncbi:hypothetical protein [Thermoflexus sp.]|uniref:type III-A CRISPR-associated protein Cas10/Csm1 n=2 Tax=Thermoflexus sp. TaxID=1969742 RepID=UPI00262C1E21|nr:hypothetical protein [Thermoflexus sp.]MCX7691205.1 hypothetical protein [Thermoflexus sp.]
MNERDPLKLSLDVLRHYAQCFLGRWGDLREGVSEFPPLDPDEEARLRLAEALAAGGEVPVAQWSEPIRLRSIFDRIEPALPPDRAGGYPLQALDRRRETLFPQRPRPAATEGEYRALARSLREALQGAEAFARGHPAAQIAGLLGAMARFAWCVPAASAAAFEDISLYDHGRVAAALAALLAEAPDEALRAWKAALRNGADAPPVALLIKGDLSGIQDFLYQVSGKGTARGLRGRSLYLQLLSEAVALFLLRQLRLPLVNLLYSSGGHFWILARPADAERLADLQRAVDRRLIAFHGMDLGLILGEVPLRPADLRPGGLKAAMDELAARIRARKLRRFADLPAGDWALLLRTTPDSTEPGDWTDCAVCGQVGRRGREIREVEGNVRKCLRCLSFEELGRQALDMSAVAWIVRAEDDGPAGEAASSSNWADPLAAFGLGVVLFNAQGEPIGDLPLPRDGEWALVWAVGSRAWDLQVRRRIAEQLGGLPTAFVPRFVLRYAPRVTAEDRERFKARYEARGEEMPEEGSIRDFEILEGWSTGIQRLGVLRADLDGAGTLFSEGLGPRMTLSRLVALSSTISRFFEGYVETLCRQCDPRRGGSGVIYALYSGGDDLFIVGAWDAVADLAGALRRELDAYTGGHPRIGLSAGLTLHGGRESAQRMAEAAGEALEEAKGYRGPDPGRQKDAFAFLGPVMPWRPGEVFHEVLRWRDRFVAIVDEETGAGEGRPRRRAGRGRSVLFALIRWALRIQRERARGRPGAQAILGPWLWQLPYFLARWQEMAEEGSGTEKLLREMRRDWERMGPAEASARIEAIWGPAARWAELLTRRGEGREAP